VSTSAYPPAFPAAFASWTILPMLSMRLTPAPIVVGEHEHWLHRSGHSFYADLEPHILPGLCGVNTGRF